MRLRAKKDKLHQAVGNVFRNHGWRMLDLSRLGDGCPDWLAAKNEIPIRVWLIEVKSPGWQHRQVDDPTRLRQAEFARLWGGVIDVIVIESVEQAWKYAES